MKQSQFQFCHFGFFFDFLFQSGAYNYRDNVGFSGFPVSIQYERSSHPFLQTKFSLGKIEFEVRKSRIQTKSCQDHVLNSFIKRKFICVSIYLWFDIIFLRFLQTAAATTLLCSTVGTDFLPIVIRNNTSKMADVCVESAICIME